MRKLNLFLIIFCVFWLLSGAIAFFALHDFPELSEAPAKTITAHVKSRHEYYLLALGSDPNSLSNLPSPSEVRFTWKETGAAATSDLTVKSSSLRLSIVKDNGVSKKAQALLKFSPGRDGELLVQTDTGGSFTLGIQSGFGPALGILSLTFFLSIALAISCLWLIQNRKSVPKNQQSPI
jgi:hypothetical protein